VLDASRPVRADDEGFLFALYADTRQEELDAWGWPPAQREAFLRMQFTARERAYAGQYPRADRRILLHGDQPIGRIVVDQGEAAIHLVDIALLAERRNAGIGTALIQSLQAEAAATGKPVRLSVLKSSRAVRLYERLGFAVVGDSGVHLAMEWRP
jgi:ribosomal protein S18 acetylase RimI-like enzyme